jgi:hypothetical protein
LPQHFVRIVRTSDTAGQTADPSFPTKIRALMVFVDFAIDPSIRTAPWRHPILPRERSGMRRRAA